MRALVARSAARARAGLPAGAAVVLLIATAIAATGAVPVSAAVAQPSAPALHALVLPVVGPGYGITAQGPLDPTTFASNSPDPTAAGRALATLGRSVDTYQRTWLDGSHTNAVQDLLVRFSSPAAAAVFLHSAQHSLDTGEIVSDGPLPSVPGAHRTTYFGSTSQPGVGEAITMHTGDYVAVLSFFSTAAGNPQPISPADAARVAKAQQAALAAAPGGRAPSSRGVTLSSLGWAALAVAVLAVAVAAPVLLRRRQVREPDPT